MATTTTHHEEPAMNTTTMHTDQSVREEIASSLCRLAAFMPYCTDQQAGEEWVSLGHRSSFVEVMRISGITTWQELLDRALQVRAAAEEVTA
jgi:hypothetical protein